MVNMPIKDLINSLPSFVNYLLISYIIIVSLIALLALIYIGISFKHIYEIHRWRRRRNKNKVEVTKKVIVKNDEDDKSDRYRIAREISERIDKHNELIKNKKDRMIK